MNTVKRATVSIGSHKKKNGILLALMVILGTLLLGSFSVRRAISVIEDSVLSRFPAVSSIMLNTIRVQESGISPWEMDYEFFSDNILTAEDIMAVGHLPYVKSFDFTRWVELFSADYDWFVTPLDIEDLPEALFNNSVAFHGHREVWGATAHWFTFMGTYGMGSFDTGLLRLVNGESFRSEQIETGAMVAIVPQGFLELNNLSVGDRLEFHLAQHKDFYAAGQGIWIHHHWLEEEWLFHHRLLEFEIIGTFEVAHELDVEAVGRGELIHGVEALAEFNNRVFVPITVADELSHELNTARREEWRAQVSEPYPDHFLAAPLQSTFILNSPRDLGAFREAANEILPEFWEARDLTDTFPHIMASMDMVLQIADWIMIAAIGGYIIILPLLVLLFLQERKHEVGLYLALGEKKFKIVGQFLMEIFVVALVGIGISLFGGNLVASSLSQTLLEQSLLSDSKEEESPAFSMIWEEIDFFRVREMEPDEIMAMYDTSLDFETVALFVGGSLLIVFVSVIVPIISITRINPKRILM